MQISGGSRPLSSGKRLSGLDHLRALAIILVFIYHYCAFLPHPSLLARLGSFGWTGVDLFFVLSGYLVGGQLLSRVARDQPISYSEFYVKRSLRIIPAYLAVLLLYFTIPAFAERSTLPPAWKFLTFTQNFGLDISHQGAFSHAWSLCIEEQFYLILPLFIIGLTIIKAARQAVWLLPALFLLGLLLRLWSWYHFLEPTLQTPEHTGFGLAYYRWIYYPTYTRLDGLLAGITLAAFYHFRPDTWQRITKYGNAWLVLSLLLLAGAWWVAHDEYQYTFRGAIAGYLLIALAYGVLTLATLSPSCILYRWSSRITGWVALVSYSLYLTHKQLNHLVHLALSKYQLPEDGYVLFFICVAISCVGAWMLHRIVEQPFLRWRDRLYGKKKAPMENKTAAALKSQ